MEDMGLSGHPDGLMSSMSSIKESSWKQFYLRMTEQDSTLNHVIL